ncbi:MAG: type IV toxin-antitoxin system AbiEi family antitoxin [Candidatus Woesearchaeota archaeon]
MNKKNYLSHIEQELWEQLKDKEIVDNELLSIIFPDIPKASQNKVLHTLFSKGRIQRAKKGLYYNPNRLTSIHKLALAIGSGYIGLSSALRHHGLLDYEDFTVFVITRKLRKNVNLKEYSIKFIPLGGLYTGFKKDGEIYVSTVEKTIVDCLQKPRHVGLSNITKAISEAKIEWKEFERFLAMTKNKSLHQRTGYLLDMLQNATGLTVPHSLMNNLLKSASQPVKLASGKSSSTFNHKWKVQDNVGEKNILSWWY